MSALRFFKAFLANPASIGAVAPSSPALADLITDAADLGGASLVVEFGPGTGVFTEVVLRKLAPGARYFAIEQNPDFAALTRARCPSATVHVDSAVNLPQYLAAEGRAQCDRIICGLPWAAFSDDLQEALLGAITEALPPGGKLVTFAYLQGLLLPAGQKFRRKLRGSFRRVTTTRTEWRNIPPAFVYVAER
ncbi:MAG: methyltransferase domain-containing protein [Proteobacteria bacterium]|nr:methyltransferase domain-containing protein [Pseudomonadota bacterium]